MKKKTASIIGIVLSIVIIVIGFCVQGIEIESGGYSLSGGPLIGSDIKFGADFYTEIYAVTQAVGEAVNSAQTNIGGAVNNAQRNICRAVESVCDAIGWMIVVIGLFAVAYFIYKMASDRAEELENAAKRALAVSAPTYAEQPQEDYSPIPPTAGGWTCTCGKHHAAYVSSCVCGVTKAEAQMKITQND